MAAVTGTLLPAPCSLNKPPAHILNHAAFTEVAAALLSRMPLTSGETALAQEEAAVGKSNNAKINAAGCSGARGRTPPPLSCRPLRWTTCAASQSVRKNLHTASLSRHSSAQCVWSLSG